MPLGVNNILFKKIVNYRTRLTLITFENLKKKWTLDQNGHNLKFIGESIEKKTEKEKKKNGYYVSLHEYRKWVLYISFLLLSNFIFSRLFLFLPSFFFPLFNVNLHKVSIFGRKSIFVLVKLLFRFPKLGNISNTKIAHG